LGVCWRDGLDVRGNVATLRFSQIARCDSERIWRYHGTKMSGKLICGGATVFSVQVTAVGFDNDEGLELLVCRNVVGPECLLKWQWHGCCSSKQ
jgi:hypothetical protein